MLKKLLYLFNKLQTKKDLNDDIYKNSNANNKDNESHKEIVISKKDYVEKISQVKLSNNHYNNFPEEINNISKDSINNIVNKFNYLNYNSSKLEDNSDSLKSFKQKDEISIKSSRSKIL